TKARTLLEETFCQVIERKGEIPSTSGDMGKLFAQAKKLYSIHADETTDRRICDLVNGLNKIVDSIGQMRNKQGDAHGVGAARVRIEDYHARLAVNAAANVADLMLSVANRAQREEKAGPPRKQQTAPRA
ncbi:MAG: abortive infection family protein, partial [Eggerthella sp.]|nr:abortive infection family protein [Eggerthella sp.]